MSKTAFAVFASSLMFLGAGCGLASKPSVTNTAPASTSSDYRDLSVCGDFPRSSGDGGPTSRYYVCRNSQNGDCYYKKTYPKQINGCDPKFNENPYGRDECFEQKADLFDASGQSTQKAVAADVRSEDACAPTLPDYFNSKVRE